MCWVEHALTRNCGGVGTTDHRSGPGGWGVERIPCLCTCELEERRLAHESTRTNDRTGDEDKEDNLGITERQPPTLCQPV